MKKTNVLNLKMRLIAGVLALTGVGLAACSAKVEGGDGGGIPLVPVETSFANKVAGPSLDGEWESTCVRDKWDFQGSQYERINVKFTGQTISRTTTKYSNSQCSAARNTLSGTALFRYAEKYADDVFSVEYRVAAGSRGFPGGDNVKRSGDRMWMSNGYLGSAVVPDIEFRFVQPAR